MPLLHTRLKQGSAPLREVETSRRRASFDNDMGTCVLNYAHRVLSDWIQDVWPKQYYSKRITNTNPLRCIMQDKKKQTQYYSHMSKAFASMCHVFATVMDKSIGLDAATVNDVNQNGLWFHAEFPTLQRLKQVTMIEAISEDGGKRFTYWTSLNMFATSAQHEDVVDDSPKRADTLDFDWDQSTADDIFVEEWDVDP